MLPDIPSHHHVNTKITLTYNTAVESHKHILMGLCWGVFERLYSCLSVYLSVHLQSVYLSVRLCLSFLCDCFSISYTVVVIDTASCTAYVLPFKTEASVHAPRLERGRVCTSTT